MKIFLQIFLVIIIVSLTSCSEKSVRIRTNFNSSWKFYLGDDSFAISSEYDDSHWRVLNLPHDWSIEGEFSEAHPTKPAGGALPAGTGWYRKSFQIPEADTDKRLYIEFDGIYRNSEVWLNGNFLGKRANGYISFSYELTPYLKYGKHNNILAVRVDNSLQPNSRWYTGSGIYRNVWLTQTSQIHIKERGAFITTPKINFEEAVVQIETELIGKLEGIENIRIETQVFDSNKDELTRSEKSLSVKNGIPLIAQSIRLKEPILWSVNNPYLYHAKISVYADGKRVDEYETPFGIRYFHFEADSGFYLNGEQFEIRGVNLHHDLGALGAAVNTRAIERQLEIMKEMGVNAIRTAHNPPAPEMLDLCDQMGFLVMDEAFDVWKKKKMKYDYHYDWEGNYKQDLQDLVLRDRNHPSVILWSIGNEIREQFDSSGIDIASELVDIVKSLDTTRPVTCALTETNPQKNYIYQSGALDVLGFNYKIYDWANFQKNFPGEKMIASENMSAYATRGHYDMPSDSVRVWPEKYGDPIIGPNADYTVSAYDNVIAFWGATHEATLKEYYKYDFMAGLFIWSGFDFIGEPIPYEWPAKSSYYGVVDLAGFPKDVFYLYKSIWTDTPTLHVFPHWNWDEGEVVDVWAYYNQADEVELFLNEESQGIKKKENDDLHVIWRLKYQPGILKVISRNDGKTVLEKEIITTGKPAKIKLSADRIEIKADGLDLSFITIEITDSSGNMVPDANNLVKFEISGEGFIAGVDNGYQASHESFKASQRKAFNGMCLAIVQSNGEAGDITLKAISDNLESAEIILSAR